MMTLNFLLQIITLILPQKLSEQVYAGRSPAPADLELQLSLNSICPRVLVAPELRLATRAVEVYLG